MLPRKLAFMYLPSVALAARDSSSTCSSGGMLAVDRNFTSAAAAAATANLGDCNEDGSCPPHYCCDLVLRDPPPSTGVPRLALDRTRMEMKVEGSSESMCVASSEECTGKRSHQALADTCTVQTSAGSFCLCFPSCGNCTFYRKLFCD
mmetsp:Transcript_51464/g.92691  ORF Transcript_51464/g.92691 Transcript_51464/m.92691 type:complete len:148 (-) Transcript_51464:25-468(-)